ncbi:MAG TPA: beta-ketoacyl synthase N-terminal-like domain-containing protein [Thermomicrobiaceae bacterium]|nr:beta-ketoacyl synthase N-terminal-like domain-containing protein [Thermomicrobiaceae bacterium]
MHDHHATTDDARSSQHHGEPVAVIGMACMFPGAPNVTAFWRNILHKVDAVSEAPPEAWDTDVYYDADFSDTDKVYCKRGGYLGSLVAFDPLPHNIPPITVGGEPDQWLALQVARDAMADAGCLDLPESIRQRTAVILGKGTYLNGGNAVAIERGLIVSQTLEIIKRLHPEHSDEQLETLRQEMKRVLPATGPEKVPGLIPNIIVGRIANRLDLMGPTYTVDAACASSLIAIELALRDLQSGACDLALAGGSQVWIPVPALNVFCQLHALSHRQQIRPFDKDADGTLLGEGIGMVVLKRLADAERDGDRIYSVIRGVGVASDGRGASGMAPRVEGEEMALRRAYAAAGVAPETIELVEAHGTATPVGDVVEVQALTRVFGPRQGEQPRVALGTVKSMISHTIPAAGIAGIIKTSLALYHKVLPPTINVTEPNPKLELEKSPFYLNTETRPWIHGAPEPRRAGVNAFGFGGINAHVVLEEHRGTPAADDADLDDSAARGHAPEWASEVIVLEAASAGELRARAELLHAALEPLAAASEPVRLTDLAYTLNSALGAVESPLRLALIATSLADLRKKLERALKRLADPTCRQIKDVSGIYYSAEPLARQGKLALLFPGEGSQYPNMLAELCLHFPEVRACFERTDRIYQDHPRGYVLSDVAFPRPSFNAAERAQAEQRLMQMDNAIEAVLTANGAMLLLLRRLGLRPDAYLGHSTGEYSAMIAAGVLDLESEPEIARFSLALNRGYEVERAREGVPTALMLAIGAPREQVEAIAREAGGDLLPAMDNCPHQTVLVGERAAGERAIAILQREGLIYEQLTFDRAYHTPLFAPYSGTLRAAVAEAPVRPAREPIYSCTTSAPYPEEPEAIRELMIEHWHQPVEFRHTIEQLHDAGFRLFVEAGARGNLTAFVEDILRGRDFQAASADTQRRDGITQLNHLAGMLLVHGVALDLAYLYQRRDPKLVDWAAPAANASARGSKIELFSGWPALRISEEFAARWQAETRPTTPASSLPPAAEPRPQAPEAPEAPAACAEQPVPANLVPEVVTPGVPGDGDGLLLADYLETMDQFLALQDEVMRAYLLGPDAPISHDADWPPPELDAGAEPNGFGGWAEAPALWAPDGGAAAEPWPGAWNGFAAETHAAASAPTPAGERVALAEAPAAMPLLGEIVAHVPGQALTARRTIDLDEDRYLRDHTLGREVARTDPALLALPVMPLTMSLEILAEAAAALLPGRRVIGLRDVRAFRWLACDQPRQTLEVSAARLAGSGDEDRVLVRLRNLTEDAASVSPQASPVLEATVILAGAYPSAPAPRSASLSDATPYSLPAAQLYREIMFHGPSWQGVSAMRETSPGGALAELRVLPWDELLRGDPAPAFVLDPVVLDAAGQVIGFWTAERLAAGKIIFPFHLEALEVYGPQRPSGERLVCVAAIQLEGEHLVRSDIDVIDADGALWLRLTGWEDKRFSVPAQFEPLVKGSGHAPLSAPWPEPVARLGGSERLACRRLTASFPSDRAFWMRIWADRMLGRSERQAFAQLRLPEPRKLEWLAGRTAAKEALQGLLKTHHGLDLLPADIEILPDANGRPVVAGSWLARLPRPPLVSISHSGGTAAAIAWLPAQDAPGVIGIDIECTIPAREEFDAVAFTEDERRLLAGAPAEERAAWSLRAWCAKEATAKALGEVMVQGPGTALLAAVEPARESIAVTLGEQLALRFPALAGLPLVVATGQQDEIVYAVTRCAPGNTPS